MDVGRQRLSQRFSRHVGGTTLGLARRMGLGGGALAVSKKALLFGKRSKNFFLFAGLRFWLNLNHWARRQINANSFHKPLTHKRLLKKYFGYLEELTSATRWQ